jgi:hypothetical protein
MTSSPQRILSYTLALFLLGATGCATRSDSRDAGEGPVAKSTIQDIVKKNTDFLLSIPGVRGVAVGQKGGKPCVLVLVTQKTDDVMAKIPSQLEGYPVVVEETGTLRPLGAKAATRER